MLKGTSVAGRNLLGKDGGLGCEVKGVYKKNMVLIEMGSDKKKKKKEEVTSRTLREESEQCIFCVSLASLCSLVLRHLLTYSIIFYFHPWTRPSLIV